MLKDSKNKMQTAAATKARTDFILEKHKQGFSPNETIILLKKEGFVPVNRSRIYQILDENRVRTK